MANKAKRRAAAEARADAPRKSLEERRAEAPKATSIDGGFAHGDGPAGIFGGAAKNRRS